MRTEEEVQVILEKFGGPLGDDDDYNCGVRSALRWFLGEPFELEPNECLLKSMGCKVEP